MKYKFNWVQALVLFIVAVMLGVVLLRDRHAVTSSEKARREGNVFPAWRRDAFEELWLNQGARSFKITRRTGTDAKEFILTVTPPGDTDPKGEPADLIAVERLLSTLDSARVVRQATDSQGLGFEQPHVQGRVQMGGLSFNFDLGQTSLQPADGSSYFRFKDETPIVVSAEMTRSLIAGPETYRDKKLVRFASADLNHLSLTSANGDIDVQPLSGRAFKLKSGLRASRDTMDRLLIGLADTRAEAFINSADARARVETFPGTVTVRVSARDHRFADQAFKVGGPCATGGRGIAFLGLEPRPLGACIADSTFAAFQVNENDVVDHGLFFLHPDEIAEFVFNGENEKLDVARKQGGFRQRAPANRDFSTDESDSFVSYVGHLAEARAERVTSGEPFTPAATLVVRGGEAEEKISFDQGMVTARREADGALLPLGPALRERLMSMHLATKSLNVFDELPEAGKLEELTLVCDDRVQHIKHENGAFVYTQPLGLPIDQGGIITLIDRLRKLRAKEWITAHDDGSYGFSAKCGIGLTWPGGRVVNVLLQRMGNGVLAKVYGTDPVMRVDEWVHDATITLHLDRTLFRVRREPRAQVELTSHTGSKVVLNPSSSGEGGISAWNMLTTMLTEPDALDWEGRTPPTASLLDVLILDHPEGGAHTRVVRWHIGAQQEGGGSSPAWLDGVRATFFVPNDVTETLMKAVR